MSSEPDASVPPISSDLAAVPAPVPPPSIPLPPPRPRPVGSRFTHVVIEPEAVAALLASQTGATKAEPCGLLVGRRAGETAHIRLAVAIPNAHVTPDRGFLLATREALEAARASRDAGHAILGTFHGHLRGAPFPSAADIAGLAAASLGPGSGNAPNALALVFVIVGRGLGPRPVMRSWTWRLNRLREIPMRVGTPARIAV